MADPKHDDSFKVVDRRLFTPEGELRKEVVEQEQRDEEAAKVIGKPRGNQASAAPASNPGPAAAAERAPETPAPAAEAPAPSRTFQTLVNFLAQNAAMLLGAYPDPRTGQALLDLDGARELIDMLDTLRDKTRGNLAADDDRLLLDVLGSLKLSYMEMSKAAAQAMAEKAKSRG